MQIFTKAEDFSPAPGISLILGLGNFDGVHLGHQKILSRVLAETKTAGAGRKQAAVFTFQEHPQSVLHPGSKPLLLTSPEQKLRMLEEFGIELCFSLPFTLEFSQIEPETFAADILKKKLNVEKVFLGASARFGRGRRGDSKLMSELAAQNQFQFEEIPPVNAAGGIVSSSRIRSLIQAGQLAEAEECLGRPFSILGRVVQGDGRGKSIGYPTANLETWGYALPPHGVYPVQVKAPGMMSWLPGVLNYGRRPTFKSSEALSVLEVFILDFSADLYGKTLEVRFFSRLREERAFKGMDVLKEQIALDVEAVRRYFGKAQSSSLQE